MANEYHLNVLIITHTINELTQIKDCGLFSKELDEIAERYRRYILNSYHHQMKINFVYLTKEEILIHNINKLRRNYAAIIILSGIGRNDIKKLSTRTFSKFKMMMDNYSSPALKINISNDYNIVKFNNKICKWIRDSYSEFAKFNTDLINLSHNIVDNTLDKQQLNIYVRDGKFSGDVIEFFGKYNTDFNVIIELFNNYEIINKSEFKNPHIISVIINYTSNNMISHYSYGNPFFKNIFYLNDDYKEDKNIIKQIDKLIYFGREMRRIKQ